MTTSDFIFNTGHNFEGGQGILSPLIREIMDQRIAESGYDSEKELFCFMDEKVSTPEGTFTSIIGPAPLQRLDEDEAPTLTNKIQGFKKGYRLNIFGDSLRVTELFKEWIMAADQIQNADSSVKMELNKLMNDASYLIDGWLLTNNNEMASVYANGFAITSAFGPGSASPDGKALFANDHIVVKDNSTYSNLVTGALTETSLLSAIDKFKTDIKLGNGRRLMRTKTPYRLIVPLALETTARRILNSNSNMPGMYSGLGENANQMNVFSFEGNRIELQVSQMLGQTDGFGGVIGNDEDWFLVDVANAKMLKAFRYFSLMQPRITTSEDPATGAMDIYLRVMFGVDHYQPEVVVGWNAS